MAVKVALPGQPVGFADALEALLLDLGETARPGDSRPRSERERAGEFSGLSSLKRWLLGLTLRPHEAAQCLHDHLRWGRVKSQLLRLVEIYLDIPADIEEPFEILQRWETLERCLDPVENRFELSRDIEFKGLTPELACWKDEPGFASWSSVVGHADPAELVLDRLAGAVGKDPMPDALMNAWFSMTSLYHASTPERLELLTYRLCEALREIAMLQRRRADILSARQKANRRGDSGGARASELFALQYLEAHCYDAAGRLRKKRDIAVEIQSKLLERNTQPTDWNPSEDKAIRTIERWITSCWQELKAYQRADDLLGERLRKRLGGHKEPDDT